MSADTTHQVTETLHGQALLPDPGAGPTRRSDLTANPPVTGYWRKTKSGRSLSLSFRHISGQQNSGAGFFVPDIRQAGTFSRWAGSGVL